MSNQRLQTFFYEEEIPSFVEKELDRLYAIRHSSLKHIREYDTLEDVRTYVRFEKNKPAAIILFRLEKQRVLVINRAIQLSDEEIQKFSNAIFSRYPEIHTLKFVAIEKQARHLSLPSHAVFYRSDVWLNAPSSAEEYLNSLGANTRQIIKRYLRKIRKDFPTFSCQFIDGKSIDEDVIRTIIRLNQLSLQSKKIISSDDENEIKRVLVLAQDGGMVCIVTIDGKICAGTINYRIGDNIAFRATGYDRAYDNYRLGFLTNYLTFSECIERKTKNIHLGWDTQDYKFRLGGIQRDLETLTIFRSWPHLCLEWQQVMQTMVKDKMFKSRQLIKATAADGKGLASTLAKACIGIVQMVRQRH